MAGRLRVDQATGHVTGPADIGYNQPWPCVNGSWGSGAMNGVVMHTMVGNLPGTIAVFNDPDPPGGPRSAHFGIAQDGSVHQFGPVGKGWIAWHVAAGNKAWYGIEHADGGNPDVPLTDAQLTASAQLVECLAAFAGFPLQVTDSPSGRGYGTHAMGGAAWGGHTCPDSASRHVRSSQRPEILRRAHLIRQPPAPPPAVPLRLQAPGGVSLAVIAARHGLHPEDLAWQTAVHQPEGWGPLQRAYLRAGLWDEPVPAGMILWAGKAGQQ